MMVMMADDNDPGIGAVSFAVSEWLVYVVGVIVVALAVLGLWYVFRK